MNVRPFDWRDIPALNRNRSLCIFMDSALLLTRGPQLLPGALLSYLAPGMGIYTSVVENTTSDQNVPALAGQIIHVMGSPFAHLTFMTPEAALQQPSVAALTENLVSIAGERGALRLLADVNEECLAFDALHQSSFAIYTRQCVWQLNRSLFQQAGSPADDKNTGWRDANSRDVIAIRSLYNNLVPGLVQQIEPLSDKRPRGMVHYQAGELRAYVEFKHGHRGIWAQPFIHPDAENVTERLAALFRTITKRFSRPVYINVRSYQSWLEAILEDFGASPGPRQAVMVRHLAIQQKAARSLALPALEGGQAEISAPIVRAVKNAARETTGTTYGTNENHG